MFSGLLIILLPLIAGYLIPLRQESALRLINRFLSGIVYLILFFMGISLAFLDNLSANLLSILHYSAVTVTVICCAILPHCCGWNAPFPGKTITSRKSCPPVLRWHLSH